jgi:hypothetical protein
VPPLIEPTLLIAASLSLLFGAVVGLSLGLTG